MSDLNVRLDQFASEGSQPSAPPSVPHDPFDEAVLIDPYPLHESLREFGPIVFLDRYGCYALARYDVVRDAAKDWEVFSSAAGTGLGDIRKPGAWRPGGPIVEVDPPQHTEVRRVLGKILSPKVIREWRENFEERAEVLAERMVANGKLDGVHDIAETFVFDVFPNALGLNSTEALHERLLLIGELNFEGHGPRNERFLEAERRVAEFQDWYDASFQRANMKPGGFGEKIFLAADEGAIDPLIAPGLVRSFLRGGMDTTISTIANVLWLLAINQDQLRQVLADPRLIAKAIEESMRFESPIQSVFRTTTRDVVFYGHMLKADTKVQLFLGAANRDPRKWQRPDKFDIHRDTFGHIALGMGVHTCIGQMLARMESEAILSALFRRTLSLELDGPPERRINNNLRSLKRLPIRVAAR